MQSKVDGARDEGAALHAALGLGGRSFLGCRMAARR